MSPVITLLSLLLAGCCAQEYAVRNLPSTIKESATLAGTYYGTYGNGLSLLTVLPTDLPAASSVHTLKITTAPHSLHAFEFHSGADNGQSQVEKFIQSYPSAQIIFSSATEVIVQVNELRFQFALTKNLRREFSAIENIIPVSTAPHNLPFQGKFPIVNAPDPKIAGALNYVSSSSLQETINRLAEFWSRQSAAVGAKQAEAWLADQFLNNGATVNYQTFNVNYSANVIARFEGAVSSPVVIMGAHYDSRSTNVSDPTQRAPGAVDNGSGTGALVELAKVIRQSNLTFRYPIVAIAFSGEEQGLLGSAANANTWAVGNIVAMINADMLGYRLPGTPITLGFKDRYVTPELVASCVGITNTYVPSLLTANSSSCCSDYRSYYEKGFPAVGYFENAGAASDYPYYHTSNDLPTQIDWEQQRLETQAVIAAVFTYAQPL